MATTLPDDPLSSATDVPDPRVRGVVVVGGGPAGLQAALTVARVHRDVLLLDRGEGRNAPARHLHNLVTRDGTPPAEFRRIGRQEVAAYPTAEIREVGVRRISSAGAAQSETGTAYLLELDDGSTVTARRVVLATGVRDELPDVPGLGELWGELVVQCPFCHGHEFAGQPVAVLGAGPAEHTAAILRPVASEVVVLAHADPTQDEWLSDEPATSVRRGTVRSLERSGDGVRVILDDGGTVHVAAVFTDTTLRQAAPFAEQLGLECNSPSGCVRVDEHARTSLPGVYAAGDMAHLAALPSPVPTVAQAIATGGVAGGSVVADAIEQDDESQDDQ